MARGVGLVVLAAVLACSGRADAQVMPPVIPVTDAACPVVLESARASAGPGDVLVITYTVRNAQKRAAEALVLTAAAVGLDGEVRAVRMMPVSQKLAASRVADLAVVFTGMGLVGADDVLVVGVQAVRWNRRDEWRGALPVSTDRGAPITRQSAPQLTSAIPRR